MRLFFVVAQVVTALLLFSTKVAHAEVRLASTTSTQNSGLYDYLTPLIEADIQDDIKIIAVGTGQALKLGENGDVDLLIVHAPDKEKAFIAAGHGESRQPFMYNQFVIVGPKTDPANVKTAQTAVAAFAAIQHSGNQGSVKFTSRADNSGTHFKELKLWKAAGVAPQGDWYLETGSGMGATLNVTAASDAYTLSDSSTWFKFANKQNLATVFSGDPVLFNQYSVILIPQTKYPHINRVKAQAVADWLVSEKGQQAINRYHILGEQAFTANAESANAPKRSSAEKPVNAVTN